MENMESKGPRVLLRAVAQLSQQSQPGVVTLAVVREGP